MRVRRRGDEVKCMAMSRLAPSLLLCAFAFAANAQTQTVTAVIEADRTGPPMPVYIYGQFIEHIGGIINNGIWAEMLDDRKFYYPIAASGGGAGSGRFRLRRWTPVGPAAAVVMDTNAPYVGEHTPLVKLGGSVPRGIQQAGLAVRRGKAYNGRVVLAGDSSVRVAVTLVWGTNPQERQTVNVGKLRGQYRKFPLRFTAGGDSDDARLEISGTGKGAFHIGAVSLMPADNVQGFRREVVAALKSLRSGVYRFPGGNYVSGYEWRDTIGDPDQRPPRWDYAWTVAQPNDVGIDEFMIFCQLLEVEPSLTVNSGFGDARSAAELVEYANGAPTTAMGRLRGANGHRAPYGIKFWSIGNEMWGEWQLGVMPLKQYEIKHNLFATAMRRVDPGIKLIASGAMPDAMSGSKQSLRLGTKLVPDYLGPADWTGGMFTHCLENMDYISEHFYTYNGTHFDLAKGQQVPNDPNEPLADWMRRPANMVRAKYEHYQEYLNLISALRARPVPICLDEWAYSRVPPNSYKVVPAYAWAFNEMFRHSDVYQMGGFTFATSLASENRTDAVLNPAGLLFKLYRDHFGSIPVTATGNSPPPPPKFPVGAEQPKVNAGSDTYPLDVAAAWSSDRKTLTVAVVNPTETAQELELSVKGATPAGQGRLWRMAPANLNATIEVGRPPGVRVEEFVLDSVPGRVSIPPISVSIFEFRVK